MESKKENLEKDGHTETNKKSQIIKNKTMKNITENGKIRTKPMIETQ